MTIYDAIRYVHIFAGTIALAAFWTTATLRKGSGGHSVVGRTFLVSMAVIAITGAFIALAAFGNGRVVFGAFLLYLVLIVVTPSWLGWRAMRDKRDVKRYTGPVYHAFAWVNVAAGLAMLALGIVYEDFLIGALSAVGLLTGVFMLRFARNTQPERQWWLRRHYVSMLGAGVGTHIAFLNLGLSHILPTEWSIVTQRMSWGLPFAVFLLARLWLDRKYGPRPRATKQPALVPYGEGVAGGTRL